MVRPTSRRGSSNAVPVCQNTDSVAPRWHPATTFAALEHRADIDIIQSEAARDITLGR